MPIITVQFIKDVVATPEQKRQIVTRLTDVFVEIVGEVTRPFVYCMIKETPQMEWAIAGVPMPDLVYLTSDAHAQVIERSNALMRGAIAQMQGAAASAPANGHKAEDAAADAVWRHEAQPAGGSNGVGNRQEQDRQADALWRGGAAAPGGHSTAEAHRRLFERWFEELWNKKNYDVAYELVDPNFTAHGAGGQDIRQGPDGVVEMVKAWHAAMPDGHMTIDDIITEGDLSTIRMTWRATHLGQFGSIPPSGKQIEVTSFGIDRVVNGKITEGWGEVNLLSMFQQMGAIPTPNGGESNGSNSSQTQTSAAVNAEQARVRRNREIIHRFYEAVNSKNTAVFYDLVHPDFVNHGGASGDLIGPAALIESLQHFYDAMPDWHVSEDYVVAQGDRVASRGTITGTHLGPFMGVPPSGKKVTWTGLIIYRLDDDGRIIERWQDFDAFGMLQQMGVIPMPGGAPQPADA